MIQSVCSRWKKWRGVKGVVAGGCIFHLPLVLCNERIFPCVCPKLGTEVDRYGDPDSEAGGGPMHRGCSHASSPFHTLQT